MAENTQLAEQPKRQVGPVQQVKLLLNEDTVKKRFSDVLGKKAPQFMASIVNVVSASPQLKQCDANSIMAASFVAASFDLPIDSNLGFAALVPYKKSFKDKETGQTLELLSLVRMWRFNLDKRRDKQIRIRTCMDNSISAYLVETSDRRFE